MTRNTCLRLFLIPIALGVGASVALPVRQAHAQDARGAQYAQSAFARQDPGERQRERQELRQQIVEQRARAIQERSVGGPQQAQAPVQQGGYAGGNSFGPPGYRNNGAPRLSVEERQQLRRQLREAHGQQMGPEPIRP